jgi:Winged helix-turn-helix domain (DUF2582)
LIFRNARVEGAIDKPITTSTDAIGWLAREEKIEITLKKRSFYIRLKEMQAKSAGTT